MMMHTCNSSRWKTSLLVLISKLELFGAKIRDASVEMVDEKNGVDDFKMISEPSRRW